jgi:hypothetical protein
LGDSDEGYIYLKKPGSTTIIPNRAKPEANRKLRTPFLRKSKLVARKKGRYAEKASAGKEIQSGITPCFRKARRAIGRPARSRVLSTGRPYNGFNLLRGKEGLARPTQKMNPASWFLRAMPLLSGRAATEAQ